MRKNKRGERFGSRKDTRFQIGPNSHPRKVARWFARGGGVPMLRTPEKMAGAHIHPRSKRVAP